MTPNQAYKVLLGRKRLAIATLSATVFIAGLVTLIVPRQYVATASVVVSYDNSMPYEDLNTQVQLSNSYMITQVNIVQSRKVALKVVDNLKLGDDPKLHDNWMSATEGRGAIRDWLAGWLLSKLTVEPSRSSRVVDITYQAPDPNFAAKVANAFADAYIEVSVELSADPARQATAWMSGELSPLRGRVETARAKLTAYQQQHEVIATDERLDTESARLQSLSTELLNAQTEAQDTKNREEQLQQFKASGRKLDTLPEIADNNFIQTINAELLRKESDLTQLASTLGTKHPQYQRAQADIRDLRRKRDSEIALFTASIRDKAQLATQRVQAVSSALAEQKRKVLDLKQQHDEIAVLQRDVDGAQRAYDEALTHFDQLSMGSHVTQTNAFPFNQAVPPLFAAIPNVKENLIIAVVAGTLLGLGLVVLVENLDRRVRTARDLDQALEVPVLGMLGSKA